ncbi:hypothetical protein L1987_18925 [Smallanthus sonchifolius]|uniref:Uncharacterized protein n=1 Tax=Smallanthus sonchifolius TaxID=185202 RepID=A0ACB9J1H4_9ASTR|nr:hypothetical protein L1987_18925 [Smallanthus sonchifolius]
MVSDSADMANQKATVAERRLSAVEKRLAVVETRGEAGAAQDGDGANQECNPESTSVAVFCNCGWGKSNFAIADGAKRILQYRILI